MNTFKKGTLPLHRILNMQVCVGIWIYCAALITPPWLFGWSSFKPEGLLVTCSWDYTSRTLSNRIYYVYLLVFGFVLPVVVLMFCYSAIFRVITRSAKEITRLITTSDGGMHFSKTTMSFLQRRRQTEVWTAMLILWLVLLYLTAWTPYAVVSLIGQFGPLDDDGQVQWLSPLTTSIPAFFAKTAIVLNPLVYGFCHPQFRRILRQLRFGNNCSDCGGANNSDPPCPTGKYLHIDCKMPQNR